MTVDKKEIRALIEKKTKEVEEIIENVKDEIAALADEGGVLAYWGEYGSGETYYPKGTDVEKYYISWHSEHYSENGKLTQGLWISSSEMC